jgi:hypothetical protein
MKNKILFFFIAMLLLTGIAVNSCKKDNNSSIQTLFTTGRWQLASVLVYHYLGSSQTSVDTFNTTCDTTQYFTFPNNNTCTYTNYHCVHQDIATGTWSLTHDQLFLLVNITCTDTLPGGSATTHVHPFGYTKILALGPYSMILQTGDIGAYYTSTTKRTVYQYGFVHLTTTTK